MFAGVQGAAAFSVTGLALEQATGRAMAARDKSFVLDLVCLSGNWHIAQRKCLWVFGIHQGHIGG